MQLGIVGLGRMGANMTRRLLANGHQCVVFDRSPDAVAALTQDHAFAASSLADLVNQLTTPRVVWLMVPAAVVDATIVDVVAHLAPGDILIDGGNSCYVDDIRRARDLAARGIHYVDVGTSGGVWGRERGYCLMIGGERDIVDAPRPDFRGARAGYRRHSHAPPDESATTAPPNAAIYTAARTAPDISSRWCTTASSTGVMAAYAEGLGVLRAANVGGQAHTVDAETAPLRHPEHYQYDFDLRDITELWRRGSVIASWLLDLSATSFARDPGLAEFSGRVSDSGEGRWTINAAIDEGVPVPVLSAALYQRFSSRGESQFADRVLSAMRFEFGGHRELASPAKGDRDERRLRAMPSSSSERRVISPTKRFSRRCTPW